VWSEIDLNIAVVTTRRDLMTKLGLGVRRGVLLAGPPGVGKTVTRCTKERPPADGRRWHHPDSGGNTTSQSRAMLTTVHPRRAPTSVIGSVSTNVPALLV
jgi:hypothetical protein